MSKVGFVGVGKLGLSCAEMIAEKHQVIGFDIKTRKPSNFKMVDSIKDVVVNSDIVFIAVETPHDDGYDGRYPTSHLPAKDFDYTVVKSVLAKIANYASNQLVVLISTILPGTIRNELYPYIKNINFIYNPYLIAMGTIKWDMVNPEMIMIGSEFGERNTEVTKLIDFYQTIMQNNPRYVVGTWEECECIKVFYNTFISAKVSLVNMIQDVAMKVGNTNAEFVCDALAESTQRITGKAYMKPGMGDGGACHPRDNIALRFLSKKLSLGYDLFETVMFSRERQAYNMALYILDNSNNLPVVIVGKTYKPLVPFLDGSSSILLGYFVESLGKTLHYLDFDLQEFPPNNLGPALFLMAHDPEVTYGKQISFVTDWYKNHELTDADMAMNSNNFDRSSYLQNIITTGSVVVDPWRKFPSIEGINVLHYGNTRIFNK